MGQVRNLDNVKLFTSVILSDPAVIPEIERLLILAFGEICSKSNLMDFPHTDYYAKEMGSGLKRIFFFFVKPYDTNAIFKAKIETNDMEARLLLNGKRTVNIDPGYLELSKVVLLSTKDYTHRIHVGSGIFAEITLFYKDGTFNPWPWTYPDYKTPEYIYLFNCARNELKSRAKIGRYDD